MVLFYFMGCFCTILGLFQINSIALMKVVNEQQLFVLLDNRTYEN